MYQTVFGVSNATLSRRAGLVIEYPLSITHFVYEMFEKNFNMVVTVSWNNCERFLF